MPPDRKPGNESLRRFPAAGRLAPGRKGDLPTGSELWYNPVDTNRKAMRTMEFATLHMDTYKIVRLLQEKGYSEQEAEGFIQAIQEITLAGVATRQDIAEVKKEIAEVKSELRQELKEMEIRLTRFIMGNSVAVAGIVIGILKFFG